MTRVSLPQTAFTSGEVSPRVHGRTDAPWYATALKRSRNGMPVIHGGWKRRPGTFYTLPAVTTTNDGSTPVPFVNGRDSAWFLEFSALSVRVISRVGAVVATLTTPYAVGDLAALDYCQRDSVMYLFHARHPIQVLQRSSDGAWRFGALNITRMPFAEIGHRGGAMTLSAATVGTGRTATSTGAFVDADIGRVIEAGAGRATVTAVADADTATVTISEAFAGTTLAAGAWVMGGTPLAGVTPSDDGPVGAAVTATADADCWRSSDVGSMIRINGGLLRIVNVASATVADCVVDVVLSATVAAPADAWTLEAPVWSSALGYPRTGTIHQQRLIAAGSDLFPRTVWGSKVGDFQDFGLGINDADAYAHTIDGDEASPIAYVSASTDLVVLTESGEYSLRGGVEKPITPTNVRAKPESGHGCQQVRPVTVGRETVFVARGGRKVRSLGYRSDFDGYNAPDIAALAEHMMAGGVVSLAYQRELEPTIWAVRADGALLSCTFDRDQQPAIVAWSEHDLGGVVESVAALPSGDRTDVWVIVRRTINGSSMRYIERLDDAWTPIYGADDGPIYGCTVDSGVQFSGAVPFTSFSVPHLAGLVVDIVADGSKLPRVTLPADGSSVDLPRPANKLLIGLPFSSVATLLTPEFVTSQGSAQGQQTRSNTIVLRFLDTIGAKVINSQGNEQEVPFRRFGPGILNEAPEPFTGSMSVQLLGWERGVAEISIVQDDPMPLHLLSVTRTHTVNG